MMTTGKSVLICDDEAMVRNELKQWLVELGFHNILECGDGESAVAVALSRCPDLILLDASLPKMDGLSAARVIRKKLNIPILLLVDQCDQLTIRRAGKCTISALLSKPLREQDLWPAIVLATAHVERVRSVREELNLLQELSEKQQIVNRAKVVLMHSRQLTEAEAYRRMRRLSEEKRIEMVRIAEAILLTEG